MSATNAALTLQEFPEAIETPNHAAELIRATEDVLSQGLTLLFELGDAAYSRTAGAPFRASIGGHYRHVLEHFESLIKGLRADEINYDARERNMRLQSELAYCIGHAIHHYAIIRLICHELAVRIPAEFGVAPSTLKHHAAAAS